MVRNKKLSRYLIVSALVHLLIALAMSRIYAEQPRRHRLLQIVGTVKIQYKEPEPPPEPEVVTKVQPKEKPAPREKKQEPKVTKEVAPPKVIQQKRRVSAPAPGLAFEKAPQRSRSAPGVVGTQTKGTQGPGGDLPGMRASAGINSPRLNPRTGGSGLSPGQMHGSIEMPTGTGRLPGKGGSAVAGFRAGVPQARGGIGRVEIPGSGGSDGRTADGPGAGVAVSRSDLGGGKATTGLGVGTVDGMGEIDSEPTGGEPDGGGGGGPGMVGRGTVESRGGPSLANRSGSSSRDDKELPATKKLPEEKRTGGIGRKEFKADLTRDMTSVTQTLNEPASTGFEDALQGEINKNLYSLRKMHEDWRNRKIPNIPKALQITIELGMEKGKPKLLNVDFHNPALPSTIKNDLNEKIKEWKFESLYDGKDDPEKWPIKLSGKVSWQ